MKYNTFTKPVKSSLIIIALLSGTTMLTDCSTSAPVTSVSATPIPSERPVSTAPPERGPDLLPVSTGYLDKLSYNPGETATLYLNVTAPADGAVRLYNINGKIIDRPGVKGAKPQKALNDADQPWKNGFKYEPTFTYKIPDLKSGLYLWENKIPFIVKSTEASPDIVIIYPFNTINAYNKAGGKSLYDFNSTGGRADAVSFLRPMLSLDINLEYCDSCGTNVYSSNFLQWFEEAGKNYKVKMISDQEMDNYNEIANAKLLIIVGQSSYWTRKARENYDKFIDSGKHALILSGTTMYWQARYSDDKSQLINYKDVTLDPVTDPLLKTIGWKTPSLAYPQYISTGAEFAGYGNFTDRATRKPLDKGWDGYKIVNPDSPLLEGTGLKKGDIISVPTTEYDGTKIKDFSADGYPDIDTAALGFYKAELVGFDWAYDESSSPDKVATFFAFQKSQTSGKVINTGSTNWGSYTGIAGKDGDKIKTITLNMINKLLNNQNIFSK